MGHYSVLLLLLPDVDKRINSEVYFTGGTYNSLTDLSNKGQLGVPIEISTSDRHFQVLKMFFEGI
jgi:hypothetical protein